MNVLLVVLGSVRADHLSCAGYHRETTPFLDELAREGVRYQNMLTTAPHTLAAHASLMTGLFAVTHGAIGESQGVSSRWRLLPEYMREAGYRTAAFCANPRISPETGFGRGFDWFWGAAQDDGLAGRAVRCARKASDRVLGRRDSEARRVTESLLEWIGASPEPFFGFVHYNAPGSHPSLPAPYDRMFLPHAAGTARRRRVPRRGGGFAGNAGVATDGDAAVRLARYDGELRHLDECLREVAGALELRGMWDHTLFVVTADHGENLGEHGLTGHGLVLYDTLLRVPLILRYPSLLPRGFVVDELAQSVDVLPTVLRLAGVDADVSRFHGRSLFVNGQVSAGPAFAISECFGPDDGGRREGQAHGAVRRCAAREKAIRTRREKFIWHSHEENRLYDLLRDPGEETNIIDDEPERAVSLRRALFDWLASVDRFQPVGQAL